MRRATASVSVSVLISVLGACGGSDDPAPADEPTTSATSADAGGGEDPGAVIDACAALPVDAVGAILGGTVTAKEVPGGGCSFDQEDPRAPSAGISGVSDAGGGFEASKGGNVTDGTVEEVPVVGDGAWVAIGRTGGDNLQGQGVVAVGSQLVDVAVLQGQGLDEATVKKMTVDLLTLAASKA